MSSTSHDSERLRRLMDACRIGSDDLSLPEMSNLAAALREDTVLRREWDSRQRSERVVGAAMHDLTVPAGLGERILAAAAASQLAPLAQATDRAVAAEAQPNADVVTLPGKRPTLWTRRLLTRRQWQWAGGLALVLMAAIAVWQVWLLPPEKVSREQLASSAQAWFEMAVKRTGQPAESAADAPVSFPAQAVSRRLQAWRQLKVAEESPLVAFDLTDVRDGGSVFLFAARTSKKYEVKSVPYTRLNATGGLEVGAWQQGNVIYVLVIDTRNSRLRLENVLRDPKLALVAPGRH